MSNANTQSMTLTAEPTAAVTATPANTALTQSVQAITPTTAARTPAVEAAIQALPGGQTRASAVTAATLAPTAAPTATPSATAALTPTPVQEFTTAQATGTATAVPTQALTTAPALPPAAPQSPVWLFPAAGAVLLALLAVLLWLLRKRRQGARKEGEHASRTEITEDFSWSVGAAQHIGTRENQEDSFAVSNLHDRRLIDQKGILAVVADGVGGMDDGQIASRTVIQSIMNGFVQQQAEREPALRLLELACNAHRDVQTVNRSQGRDCGTTLIMGLILQAQLYILSIGDSRIYLYRDGGLVQLNREHTYGVELDEQVALGNRAVPEGMNPNRRKAILSYVGMEELRLIDRTIQPIYLHRGDRLLLLTDGVFGTLSEAEIAGMLDRSAQDAANALRDEVLARGKKNQDNLTAVVIACG